MRALALAVALALVPALAGCLGAGDAAVLTVGTTTSVRDSGLLDPLLDAYRADTGTRARAIVAGSGEVLEMARRGDVDVVLSHAPAQEAALVEDGVALAREPVMWNRFLLVGPADDPARAREAGDAAGAFARIADAHATFASRGDGSGTHEKEREAWALAGDVPDPRTDSWYKETGHGQAGTLRYANEKGAYALTDEATWRVLHANGVLPRLDVVLHDDALLVNAYHVLPVTDTADARAFSAWLTGPDGAAAVRAHAGPDGEPLFTPGVPP